MSSLTPETDVQVLRDQLQRLFQMPDLLPDNLLSYLLDYQAVNQFPIAGSSVVSAASITGSVTSTGGVSSGTGFSVVHSGTGVYAITFTTALSTTPVVVVTPLTTGARFAGVSSPSTSGFTAQLANSAGAATDQDFNFIATET